MTHNTKNTKNTKTKNTKANSLLLFGAVSGVSIMLGHGPVVAQTQTQAQAQPRTQEINHECEDDLQPTDEFDLYQCAVEEFGIVPPTRGGTYSNE